MIWPEDTNPKTCVLKKESILPKIRYFCLVLVKIGGFSHCLLRKTYFSFQKRIRNTERYHCIHKIAIKCSLVLLRRASVSILTTARNNNLEFPLLMSSLTLYFGVQQVLMLYKWMYMFFLLDHAPFSKGLLVLTGTASFFNILFVSSTRHFFSSNPWIQIVHNSKVKFEFHSYFWW